MLVLDPIKELVFSALQTFLLPYFTVRVPMSYELSPFESFEFAPVLCSVVARVSAVP